MLLVLVYLAEAKSGESREIADKLRVSPKRVSVLLGRCLGRGLVTRTPYKRGRERGYTYALSEKGAQWILHRVSKKEKQLSSPVPEPEAAPKLVPVVVYRDARPEPREFGSLDFGELVRMRVFIDFMNQLFPKEDPLPSLLVMRDLDKKDAFLYQTVFGEDEKNARMNKALLFEALNENEELFRMVLHRIDSSIETKRVIKAIEKKDEQFGTRIQRYTSKRHGSKLLGHGRSSWRWDMATRHLIRTEKELPAKPQPFQQPQKPTAEELTKPGSDAAIHTDKMAARTSGWQWRCPTIDWDKVEESIRKDTPPGAQQTVHVVSPKHAPPTSQKTSATDQTEPKEPKEDWESFNLGWHRWHAQLASPSAQLKDNPNQSKPT